MAKLFLIMITAEILKNVFRFNYIILRFRYKNN